MASRKQTNYPPEILSQKTDEDTRKVNVMVRLPRYVLNEVEAEAQEKGVKPAELLRCQIYDKYFPN